MSDALRKAVALAMQGRDMSDDPNRETNLDRLGAFAWADELGKALWRAKYANDRGQYDRALALLVKRIRPARQPIALWQKVARCVLLEWLDEVCRKCSGRGRMIAEGTPHATHTCSVCDGSGLRRPSEQQRMAVIGVRGDAYAKWAKYFDSAYRLIVNTDSLVLAEVKRRLGRAAVAKYTHEDKNTLEGVDLGKSHGIVRVGTATAHNSNTLPGTTVQPSPPPADLGMQGLSHPAIRQPQDATHGPGA